jgi:hypothetical protein
MWYLNALKIVKSREFPSPVQMEFVIFSYGATAQIGPSVLILKFRNLLHMR